MMTKPKPKYSNFELKRALTRVFQSVWFDNLTLKLTIQNSYFDNFHHLVDYARANGIDEMEYICSIRDCLSEHKRSYRIR